MADIAFTPFSASLSDRPTAFGLFDADVSFQADADKTVYYVMRNLGSPVLDTELDLRQIWTDFETATVEYSSTINAHHARNILLDMLGQPTGSLTGSENLYPPGNSMQVSRRMAMQYSTEAGTGGTEPWFTASILVREGVQRYDLWTALSGVLTGSYEGRTLTIRRIHHHEPTSAYRFFDTTSVLNYMNNAMGAQSYTPETIFYLLPIWEDVLRGTQLELNQRVRRSNYSFDLRGYQLTLYPEPSRTTNLWIEYTISTDPTAENARGGQKTHGVTSNISNIAFGHISYSSINSIGKTWIWRMTGAMSKERLGLIRSKYGSMPLLGEDINLNGPELINQGREEQQNLRIELKEMLDQMSYGKLMEEKINTQKLAVENFKFVPSWIYISK